MLNSGNIQILVESIDDTHVHSSMAMIVDAATLAGSENAVILGCGRCTEIPVRHLSTMFNRIDLVDLDDYALEFVETQCQQWEEARNSCTFYHADLTGLISQIEPKAQKIVTSVTQPSSCLDELGQLLISTTPNFWRPLQDEKYNLIVCSAVLTQLQATVRKSVEDIYLNKFPGDSSALSLYKQWRSSIWTFARQLEDAFIDHLRSLLVPGGIIYLSDTVHACWLLQSDPQTFITEGAWIATRTPRLADYLSSWEEIITERMWKWMRRGQEGQYWGRLYGVQAIIYRAQARESTG